MLGLLIAGFVAGVVAGISPCVLPVLPVVLVAGTAGPVEEGAVPGFRRRRAAAVAVGLVLSFTALTLAGSALLGALGLPEDFLRDAAVVALGVVGLGLLVPRLGLTLGRPFTRLHGPEPAGRASGILLGLCLGAVFAPCAGPVLAALSVAGATRRIGPSTVALGLCFAAGAAVPLLAVALAGDQLVARVRALGRRAGLLRRVGGLALLATAVALALNVTEPLQRAVPGYTSTLEQALEGGPALRHALASLTGEPQGSLGDCDGQEGLARCGTAPPFRSIARWFNTPGDRPLTIGELSGKVVLVDFWTYSCINCQRSLSHVEAWYARYRRDGFVVVGVHTPEFSFEHVASNVAAAIAQFKIDYPVALDNDDATWEAYENDYWPAEYLIDAHGEVRHIHFGEGDYGHTEALIRQLLLAAHPGLRLPPPTDVATTTPTEPTNPETYLGYDRLAYLAGPPPIDNQAASYSFPAVLPAASVAFSGTWTIGPEAATAGAGARLELSYQAKDVYLVMGGHGTLVVTDGGAPTTVSVGGPPRLYRLFGGPRSTTGTLVADVPPGVACYDFTFG